MHYLIIAQHDGGTFSNLRARNFDQRRTKVSNRKCECTKALFELTNYCEKTIDKRYLIDQSVIKAAIFPRSPCILLSATTHSL